MQLQKLSILFLTVFTVSLYGMELDKGEKNNSEKTNWTLYKKAFSLWLTQEGRVAADKYWNPLKDGIQKQQIRFNTTIEDVNNPQRVGFIAYTGSVDNQDKTICLVLSPSWMYSPTMGMNNTDNKPEWHKAYAISFVQDLSFPALGFSKCKFGSDTLKLKNSKLLPKHLHPKKGIMPGWKNPIAFAVWVKTGEATSIKTVQFDEDRTESKGVQRQPYASGIPLYLGRTDTNEENNDLSSQSESESDDSSSPRMACGIHPLPRAHNNEENN